MHGNDIFPFVSVIVPVYNDAERLKLCLAALNQQIYPRTYFEIIVIDNASDSLDSIKAVIEQYRVEKFSQEFEPGSYAARNRGVQLAKGEIIAFTDSDCIPAKNWLEAGVSALETTPQCDMVVGQVNISLSDSSHPNIFELYELVTAFPQEKYLSKFKGGATANLLTRKEVIEQVGKFNFKLKSFGDLEWGRRVFLAGYRQKYVPVVKVQHPARHSRAAIDRKNIRTAGGLYDYFVKQELSWLKRNRAFIGLLIGDVLHSIKLAYKIMKSDKISSLRQKIAVVEVMLRLRFLAILEKVRLHRGGISKRF